MSRRNKQQVKGKSEKTLPGIPSGMDAKEVEEMRTAFELFNLEEGRVTVEDLLKEMETSGLNERYPSAVALLKEAENQGDGTLDFVEFLELMNTDVRNSQTDEQFNRLFRLIDVEGEGSLNSEQMRKLFEEIGETFSDEDWTKQFNRLDDDNDGKINFFDFMKAIGKMEEEAL